ncbi:hypothetical protein LTR94_029295 [Friedmanniomyces endolithicus]|nr:hypothetical protein LTR94_029295 [Friedmanniomyces endolithicus]
MAPHAAAKTCAVATSELFTAAAAMIYLNIENFKRGLALAAKLRRMGPMDDLKSRWARLEPHVSVVGPDDDLPRPAVLLFHGCGGLRSHLPRYAEAAKARGWRAFIVDSYGPRGWGRAFTLTAVCTGLALRGYERAGDVLAAIQGISQRPDVDETKLTLAGW